MQQNRSSEITSLYLHKYIVSSKKTQKGAIDILIPYRVSELVLSIARTTSNDGIARIVKNIEGELCQHGSTNMQFT